MTGRVFLRNSSPFDASLSFALSHGTVALTEISPVEGAGIGSEVGIGVDIGTAVDAPEVGERSLVAILSSQAGVVAAGDLGEAGGGSSGIRTGGVLRGARDDDFFASIDIDCA